MLSLQRIPSEWVRHYGNDIPTQCVQSMPNGICFTVDILKLGTARYFTAGWDTFVRRNNLQNQDSISFTHIGGGEFHVLRFNSLTGCPSRADYDGGWLCPLYFIKSVCVSCSSSV